MKIGFDLSRKDIMAFVRYHTANDRLIRGRILKSCIIYLFFVAIWIVLYFISKQTVTPFLVLAIVFLIFTLLSPLLVFRATLNVNRRIYYLPENSSFFGRKEMVLDENGIEVWGEDRYYKYGWKAILKVIETKKYFFLFLSSFTSQVIPKEQISGEQTEQLSELFESVNLLQQKIKTTK